jgi:hypothetical protein
VRWPVLQAAVVNESFRTLLDAKLKSVSQEDIIDHPGWIDEGPIKQKDRALQVTNVLMRTHSAVRTRVIVKRKLLNMRWILGTSDSTCL